MWIKFLHAIPEDKQKDINASFRKCTNLTE